MIEQLDVTAKVVWSYNLINELVRWLRIASVRQPCKPYVDYVLTQEYAILTLETSYFPNY